MMGLGVNLLQIKTALEKNYGNGSYTLFEVVPDKRC